MKKRQKHLSRTISNIATTIPISLLLVLPSSFNYQLKSLQVSGGGNTSSSTTYQVEGSVGEVGGSLSSSTYKAGTGLVFTQLSNTPGAPTLTNGSNWYDKLHLVIDTASNPTDTVYAVAISSDNWATTQYVQANATVGSTEVFQTYSGWGGASGIDIIGLSQNTTYKVKVSAKQGEFTQGPFGPEASAATSPLSLSFDIDVAPTDTETAPPYTLSMGNLTVGGVTTATDKIWVDLDTNADNGGFIYVYDQYAGLQSINVNHKIPSASTNLTSATEGYGIQSNSATNLTAIAPYNGPGDTVGLIDSTVRELYDSSFAPVTGGRASMDVKAKTSNVTPSADDYSDTLTLITAAEF